MGSMLRVRDIMTTDLVTVTPDLSVRECMELLGARHVSGAPVLDGRALVGVVSASDLLVFASALSGTPTERDLNEEWGAFAEPTAAQETEHEAEVEDEPASAYFAELWDDAGADVAERFETTRSPEWNALDEHDVSEVMTRAPLATLPPDAPAEQAAALMRAHGIHRVLVTDGDALVGVVSSLDVATAAADQRLTRRVYAFNRDGDFPAEAGE